MSEERGDFVIIVSPDLISKVMKKYFNEEMFMIKVEVVDLQPSEGGYVFNLEFVDKEDDVEVVVPGDVLRDFVQQHKELDKHFTGAENVKQLLSLPNIEIPKVTKRNNKGRFVKKEV